MSEFKLNTNSDNIFIINFSQIEERFDSHFYLPKYNILLEKLYKNHEVKNLNVLLNNITNGFDCRDYKASGTVYIKVANVKKGEFDLNNVNYIELKNEDFTKNISLKKGNLLLTRKGSYGRALALVEDLDYIISSEVFYLELNQDLINSKYLEIYFNSNIGQLLFKRNSIGAIMGSLSQEAVKKLPIPLPPKEIQQKIVTLYNQAFQKKQQKEAQAQELLASIDVYLLDELGITLPVKNNALENRMFTTSLSDVSGGRLDANFHSNYNIELLKSLFESKYELEYIKKHTDFIPGYAFSSSDYLQDSDCFLITIKNISKNQVKLNNVTYLPSIYFDLYKQYRINEGDLLIAMTGATIGKVGIYNNSQKALINQRNGIIRPNENLNTQYLLSLLNTTLYQELILSNSVGGAQPNISETDITKIKIPLPPIEKQTEIANHISTIRNQAKQLEQEANQIMENAKAAVETIILGE